MIGPNGVPIDTPEVQHARAAHLKALAEASARSHGQGYGYAGYAPVAYAPAAVSYSYGAYGGAYGGYASPHAVPAIAADGTPLDTPEVAAAKAHHFAAYNEAAARNSYHGYAVAPVETPEVSTH